MNTMAQIATSTLPAVLAISGSDSSGGAGMQADLKTMLACGVFGMSAITALTAQNTTGVRSIQDTKPDILADQINMVFEDIPPVAVKIGMVSATDIIDVIAEPSITPRTSCSTRLWWPLPVPISSVTMPLRP